VADLSSKALMEEAGCLISVVCVVMGLTARIDIKGITRDGRRCTLSLMGRVSGMTKPSLDGGEGGHRLWMAPGELRVDSRTLNPN
jgi:hypothetical protein